MTPWPWSYRYYCYVVIHQWALLEGWSGVNRLSVRAWLKQPTQTRRDFRLMIIGGGEL